MTTGIFLAYVDWLRWYSYNTKIAVQLMHSGARSRSSVTGEPPAGPSAISSPDLSETPRELTKTEIRDLVLAFGEAARRANEAGFDAIELHCSAAYLIHQFLSPYSNRRTDEYGGNFSNRMRFAVDTHGQSPWHFYRSSFACPES